MQQCSSWKLFSEWGNFYRVGKVFTEWGNLLQSGETFYRVGKLFTEWGNFLQSGETFFRVRKLFTEWGNSLACSHACSETTALGANHIALGIAFLCVRRNVPRKSSSPIRVVPYPVLAFGWWGVLFRHCSPGVFRSLMHGRRPYTKCCS